MILPSLATWRHSRRRCPATIPRQRLLRTRSFRTYAVLRPSRLVPNSVRDLRHGLDTDDALDCEVRLVFQVASEVVRAQLRRRYERLVDEELRPLVESIDLKASALAECAAKNEENIRSR